MSLFADFDTEPVGDPQSEPHTEPPEGSTHSGLSPDVDALLAEAALVSPGLGLDTALGDGPGDPEETVLPIDERSRAALDQLVASPPAGTLVILVCEFPAVAQLCAETIGLRMLSPRARGVDLLSVTPESGRWSVAEVNDVLGRAAYVPEQRHMIAVGNAEEMEPAVGDHLLKAVEEPAAPTLWMFCVRDQHRLSPTLLGRASAIVTIEVASQDDTAALLAAAGCTSEEAEQLAVLAQHLPKVLMLAAQDDVRDDIVQAANVMRRSPRASFTLVSETVEAMTALARLIAAARPAKAKATKPRKTVPKAAPKAPKSASTLTPAARTQLRVLAQLLISDLETRARAELLADVCGPHSVAVTITAARRRLDALETARRRLRLYLPVAPVLSSLYYAWDAPEL